MRIVIACDKFKGSLSAIAACEAIADGWRAIHPEAVIDLCPVADGGEGTVAALVGATGGRFETARVTGPLPDMKIDATFGFLGDQTTAVIEMAAASGLALLSDDQRDPRATTTFGTGQLLNAAVTHGATHIILGIGGSATLDGGIGCAQACGLPVLLDHNEPVSDTEPLTGADLERVVFVKHGRGGKVERVSITVACDVTNPLYGPDGAAAVFGPQKGATPDDVRWFDAQLKRLALRNNVDAIARQKGAGAAGGLGFAMMAFFGATLVPGAAIVLDAVNFADRLKGADLCITGEGSIDASSAQGKVTGHVAALCKQTNVPCVALVGQVGSGAQAMHTLGLSAMFSICDGPMKKEEAQRQAPGLLRKIASNVARLHRPR